MPLLLSLLLLLLVPLVVVPRALVPGGKAGRRGFGGGGAPLGCICGGPGHGRGGMGSWGIGSGGGCCPPRPLSSAAALQGPVGIGPGGIGPDGKGTVDPTPLASMAAALLPC